MNFKYEGLARIPKQLEPGVVYHSKKFGIAALLCACGCGHRVDLIVPESHRVTAENGLATIRPSIAVCDAACRSHYIIDAGQVRLLQAFSDTQAASVMRDQIARHAASELKELSWFDRLLIGFAKIVGILKSIFCR